MNIKPLPTVTIVCAARAADRRPPLQSGQPMAVAVWPIGQSRTRSGDAHWLRAARWERDWGSGDWT